jgi:hypothetical protein
MTTATQTKTAPAAGNNAESAKIETAYKKTFLMFLDSSPRLAQLRAADCISENAFKLIKAAVEAIPEIKHTIPD